MRTLLAQAMYSTTECWWCVHSWRRRNVLHDAVLVLRALLAQVHCKTHQRWRPQAHEQRTPPRALMLRTLQVRA